MKLFSDKIFGDESSHHQIPVKFYASLFNNFYLFCFYFLIVDRKCAITCRTGINDDLNDE